MASLGLSSWPSISSGHEQDRVMWRGWVSRDVLYVWYVGFYNDSGKAMSSTDVLTSPCSSDNHQ